MSSGLDVSSVPELDGGIGLGGGEEEVLAAGGEPLDGGDGGGRGVALDGALVGVVEGVDSPGSEGVKVRVSWSEA